MRLTVKGNAAVFGVGLLLLGAVLACQGDIRNMTINGVPKYVCPSATPRPTSTPLPPDPPTYPASFQVTLDYSYIDPTRTWVTVQYLAQNVGALYLSYSATYSSGATSTSSPMLLAATANYAGVQSSYSITFPTGIAYGQIYLSSSLSPLTYTIVALTYPYPSQPNPPPCCLTAPIYPTPRPTTTPYPSPTPFEMLAPSPFFLDDPIYNYQPPVQLRLRMKSPVKEGQLALLIPLLAAASWSIEITNVGSVEYDFLGAGYTYVSAVMLNGGTQTGVWPPSHYAATFLGIVEQAYGPQAIQPGQTLTVQVAAWIPVNGHVAQLALLLNPYQSGDPGWATFTPGSAAEKTVVHWQNTTNTICKGEIAYP